MAYRLERLLIPSDILTVLRHPLSGGNPGLTRDLGTLLGGERLRSGSRRIYVPRQKTRRVLNEEELTTALFAFDFEVIDTDSMTYDEQIRTFRDAGLVVGPHGAALTNLIVSPEDCRVLELFPRFGGSASYYAMAQAGELAYSCYIDTITDPHFDVETMGAPSVNDASMMVDIDFVKAWLGRVATT